MGKFYPDSCASPENLARREAYEAGESTWILPYLELAKQFGGSFARKHGYPIEAQDVEQEITLALWANYEALKDAPEEHAIVIMKQAGHAYCYRERNRHFHESDQFSYTVDEVKAMLPGLFDDTTPNPIGPTLIPGKETLEGFVERFDIQRAWDRLTSVEQQALRRRYEDDEQTTGNSTLRNNSNRAAGKLTYHINGGI